MDIENTIETTPDNQEAGGQPAEQATQESQPETTAKYDFGKFQKLMDEGKLSTDILEDVYSHGPGWIGRINKLNKEAADEKNKVSALRADYEKRLKEPQHSQKIEKPEDHPGVIAMKKLADGLIREGADKDMANDLVERSIRMAKDDMERQDYIRKDEIERLFEEQSKKQEQTTILHSGAGQIMEKYKTSDGKSVIDPEQAISLIAAFQNDPEDPMDGVRLAMAFIESIRTMALKEPKPKPKATIVSPGVGQVKGAVIQDEDKKIAQKQSEITARYTKG